MEEVWNTPRRVGKGTLNREAVLSQLPLPLSPPLKVTSRPTTAGGPVNSQSVNTTPGAVAEVQAVINRIQRGELSDSDILIQLKSLEKQPQMLWLK